MEEKKSAVFCRCLGNIYYPIHSMDLVTNNSVTVLPQNSLDHLTSFFNHLLSRISPKLSLSNSFVAF